MKTLGLTLTAAGLITLEGCLPSPRTATVKTAVQSDTTSATSVTAVRITVSTPTPMTKEPLLVGPLPGTGPSFSDEHGAYFPCPLFRYGDGTRLSYIIRTPGWSGPTTNVTFSVNFPADQLPNDKQEVYLDAQVKVAQLAPVPVHVRVR